MAEKPFLSLATLGPSGSGKSTLLGHLLYLCGGVSEREMDKLRQLATQLGRASSQFAFLFDKLGPERERGLSVVVQLRRFETQAWRLALVDTPGHRDFTGSATAGIAQADAGLLVVSAAPREFEAAEAATRDRALLAFTLGVRQLIVCVNKMDHVDVAFSEGGFDEARAKTAEMLAGVGFDAECVTYVATAGWTGLNVVQRAAQTPWYEGPTLLEAIDGLQPPPRPVAKPFRMVVRDCHRIGGIGEVVVGRVASGSVSAGTDVEIAGAAMPIHGQVRDIECFHEPRDQAEAGDVVGIHLAHSADFGALRRGQMLFNPAEGPCAAADVFEARVTIVNHPNELRVGYTPLVDVHTAHVPCRITAIRSCVEPAEENPVSMRAGRSYVVEMRPTKPLVLFPCSDAPRLGCFTMRDLGQVVGVGTVLSVDGAAGAGAVGRLTKSAAKR